MPSKQRPTPIRRIFEEAFNQGKLGVVDEVLISEHVANNPFTGGPQGLKGWIASFRTAFPDLYCSIEDEIQEGDKLAAHWVLRGTQKGPFMGSQPTGRVIEANGIIFARISDGRIVEDWILIDQMRILQQLGLIPPVVRL